MHIKTRISKYLTSAERRRFLQVSAALAAGSLFGGRMTAMAAGDGSSSAASGEVVRDGTTWALKGDWFDVCSCNIPCPCTFGQPPTGGHCEGVLPYKIESGHYGNVALDGLNVVLITGSRGFLWDFEQGSEGGRERMVGIFIDERATKEQHDALEKIFTGAAGGWPATFAKGFTEVLGVESAPIDIEIAPDLAAWSVRVDDRVEARAEALTGRTTPPGARVQVHNAPGAEVGPGQIATWGKGLRQRTKAFGFDLDLENVSSKHFPFDWTGTVT